MPQWRRADRRWCSWRWFRHRETMSITHRPAMALTEREPARRDLALAAPHLGAPGAFDKLFFGAELEGLLHLLAELGGPVLDDLAAELAGLGIPDARSRRPPDDAQRHFGSL